MMQRALIPGYIVQFAQLSSIVQVVLALIGGFHQEVAAASVSGDATCTLELIDSITNQCIRFHQAELSISSIGQYVDFFQLFARFRQHCLMNGDAGGEPNDASKPSLEHLVEQIQASELICEQNGFYYGQMQQFYQLIRRLQSGESVCNIEFAIKLYHFHGQVQQHLSESSNQQGNKIGQLFRLVANAVATKCRLSLANQLHDLEHYGGLEMAKHLTLVLGLANIGPKARPQAQNDALAFAEAELFVPILERELPELLFDPISSSIARAGGTTFKLDKRTQLLLDAASKSCKYLKLYHINTLGSLGLLASLGYASPLAIHGRDSKGGQLNQLADQSESKADQLLIQRWLLSALLCQPLRNIIKVSTTNGSTNEQSKAIQFVPTREPDVWLRDERSDSLSSSDDNDATEDEPTPFNTIHLRETSSTRVQRLIEEHFFGGPSQDGSENSVAIETYGKHLIDTLARFKFSGVAQILARKLHLLNGPGYGFSRAIVNYLTSKLRLPSGATRLDLIESIIGTKLVDVVSEPRT